MFEEVVISFKVMLEIFERKNESVKKWKDKSIEYINNICTEGRIFEIILMDRRKSHDAAAMQYRSSQYIQSEIIYLEKNRTFLYSRRRIHFYPIRWTKYLEFQWKDQILCPKCYVNGITWRDISSKTAHERHCVTRYLVQNVSRTTSHGEIFRLQMRKDQAFTNHWFR